MNIDKFISENKDSFRTENLTDGHEQRFEHRLQKHFSVKKKQKIYLLRASVAAIIILLLIPVLIINRPQNEEEVEIANVTRYYQNELQKEIEQLRPLLNSVDDEVRLTFEEELEKIQNTTEITEEFENLPQETLITCTAKVYTNSIESVRRLHNSLNHIE